MPWFVSLSAIVRKKHISAQEQVLNAAAQTYTYTCNKDNQIRILYVKGSSNDTYCLCSLWMYKLYWSAPFYNETQFYQMIFTPYQKL